MQLLMACLGKQLGQQPQQLGLDASLYKQICSQRATHANAIAKLKMPGVKLNSDGSRSNGCPKPSPIIFNGKAINLGATPSMNGHNQMQFSQIKTSKQPFNSKILSTTKQGPSMSLSDGSMTARRRSPAKTLPSLSPQAKSMPLKLPLLYVPPFLWKYHTPQLACLRCHLRSFQVSH